MDPARRDTHNRKKFLLEDLSPDITEIQNKLFEFTDKVVVKLSPLMDISMLVSQVPGISEIYIIAVKNEVKELLIVIEKDFNQSPAVKFIIWKAVNHHWKLLSALSSNQNLFW